MSSQKKKPNKNKNKIAPAAPAPAPVAAAPAAPKAKTAHTPAPGSKAAKTFVPTKSTPAAAAAGPASAAAASSAARPSLLVSAADDDDTPLVRGAASAASRKSPAADATAAPARVDDQPPKEDVLFGNKHSEVQEKKQKRKAASAEAAAKKKQKQADGEDEGPIDIFTGTTTAQTLKHLSDPLSHSSLKPGMLVLGAVRAVNEVDLTVQLPHGLTGYVGMREISDTIATIVDQYIEQGERAEEEAAKGNSQKSEEESAAAAAITLPVLSDFIRVGQLVHCYILTVGENAKEATNTAVKHSGANVSAQKSRRIEISLRASLFNQNLTLASLSEGRTLYGSVKSVQEKGYVVDVGIAADTPVAGQTVNNITAFLPFNKAPADLLLPTAKRTGRPQKKSTSAKKEADEEEEEAETSGARRLCVGMPIETVVTNAKNKRVLVVTADPTVVRAAIMRNSASQTDAEGDEEMDGAVALKNTIGFTNLQPGMFVKASVVSIIGAEEQRKSNARMSGLYVRFLDFFHGIIDNLHSSADASIEGSLESMFHETQKLTCRILYVNYATKKIALTLLPHIIAWQPFTFPAAVKCGDKILDSIITKVEGKHGMYLRLPVKMEGVSQHTEVDVTKQKKVVAKKAAKKAAGSDDDEDMSEEESEAEEEEVAEEEQEDVSEEQSLSAWAHISRITDAHITSVPKNLTVGTTVPCRILNLHYLDAMVHVSTQPHIMDQSILYYEDVHAGMEVQGEIVSVEAFGVLLKLTPHITALIPSLHLSDIHLSDPSKKFKVGQTLKARVLYVEERQKKIICSLKKNLLNSQLPKLFDYKVAQPGLLSHGFIASMKDYGLIVEFYNKTHGLVSTMDLVRTSFLKEGQVPSDVFKRGDVHKVRIVHCDQRKQRLKLSLGLVAPKQEAGEENPIDVLAAPGTIVAAAVKEVKPDGLLLVLEEEAAAKEEAPKSKKDKKAPAKVQHTIFLPVGHLTDHPSLADALLHTYPVGHRFARLLVLHKDRALRMPVVSAKPSLLALSGNTDSAFTLPSSVDTLQPGSLLLGYIRSVADFGVFVGFLDHVSGLAPRNLLADQFIAGDLSAAFHVGQTVRAKVVTIENKEAEGGVPASTKITVTLKPSQITEEGEQTEQALALEGSFVSSFFSDNARIASQLPSAADAATPIDWSLFPLSGSFSGSVKLIKDFGLVLETSASSEVQGLVTRPYHTSEPATKKELLGNKKKVQSEDVSEISTESGAKYTLGQAVTGRVLDVDRVKKIVDVSLRPELLEAAPAKKGAKKAAVAPITKGASVAVRVQLVRKHYVVLSLPQNGNAIGYAMTTSTNSRFNPHSVFQAGYETKALVHEVAKKAGDRLLLVLDLNSALATYSAGKKAGAGLTFIDPTITKLTELQNGKKLTVQLRGLTRGAAPETAGPNSRLEAIIGEVSGKVLTGSIHISQLEESLNERAAAGDKDAKKLLKEHATTPYKPLAAWAARSGESIAARIMSIVRKVSPAHKGGKARTHISAIDLTLRSSLVEADQDEAAEGETPATLSYLTVGDVAVGQIVQAYVKDVETHENAQGIVWVVLAPGLKGRVRANALSFPAGKADLSVFQAGQALTLQVLEVHTEARLVDLVLLPLGTTKARKIDAAAIEATRVQAAPKVLEVGTIVRDLVVKRVLEAGLLVGFGSAEEHQKLARVHITDLSDKWSKELLESFKVGQSIPRAIVIEITNKEAMTDDDEAKTTQQVDLSLRQSRLSPSKTPLKFAEIKSFDDLVGKEGSLVQGFVRSTSKVGCFVSLSRNLTARCLLKNLSDGYVTDVVRHFPVGKFLSHVRIIKVDTEARTVEVSLRKGDGSKAATTAPSGESLYKYEELSVGDTVKGVITQIKPFGLFIRLKESTLSGLCHISEVSDTFIDDLSKHYEVGDKVQARVVKKDDATRKVSLGLKAKYFTDEVAEVEEAEDEDDEDAEGEEDDESVDEQMVEEAEEEVVAPKSKAAKRKAAAAAAAESSEDEEEQVEMDDSRAAKKPRVSAAPLTALPSNLVDDGEMADAPALSLDLNSSFSMLMGGGSKAAAVESDDEESEAEDEEDEDAVSKKKSRRAKAGAKKAEERALISREHAILDPTAQPESPEEFERIIVQNPNASMVWIKFMAYQISLTEIEKARKVAERALKAISFRSPQEKLNVWIALLNLENMYGTQKTMQEVFNRAVQFNDPQTVYLEVAKIYAATKKVESAVETYEGALKKFHGAAPIWLAYAQYLYTVPARVSDARDLLKRALQRLDKAEHISIICKFASLEFHVASNVDRGRTLMEGVLSNYPKRVDLWSVYLDMETKLSSKLTALHAASSSGASKDPNVLNHESIRRLFDRITSPTLSTKKMKFFFSKWLTFEKTTGGADPDRLERVKNKAREFVAIKTHQNDGQRSATHTLEQATSHRQRLPCVVMAVAMEVAEDELCMIVWSGWLKKKTPRGFVKLWRSRYFRLLGDVLEYYKSDQLGVCAGMIPLQMVSGLHIHPPTKKEGCRFDLLIDVSGNERRVFSLLAPSPDVCEKLVRSIRNMLHHPVDESARMDTANIDISGSFWKRIDEIERRRAGSSKKVDVAAQFAGFDIKPRVRRKKPDDDAAGPDGQPQPGLISGATTSRAERERIYAEATVEEVETPAIRILRELLPLPLGKLYLSRENGTKLPFFMHAVNRQGDGANVSQLVEAKELWAEMSKLNHPYLLRHVSNGESSDCVWLLYEYPHHASLKFHIASLVKQRQDSLALSILSSPSFDLLPAAPLPPLVLPLHVVGHFATQLLLILEFLHRRNLIAVNLDLAHLHLTQHGHVSLVDFFLTENKDGAIKRREPKEERYWTPELHRNEPEDYRSDYWRFGLALYELLTGRLPAGFTRSPLPPNVPLAPQQVRANILSFEPANDEHLPFPAELTGDIISLIRGCLEPIASQRIGGTTTAIAGSALAAASKSSSMATLQQHPFFSRVDWHTQRSDVRAAQLDPTQLAPAPDAIFETLLYASHNSAFAQSSLLEHVTREYQITVQVKSGRNFHRDQQRTSSLSPLSSNPAGGSFSVNGAAAPATSSKFYIKVLVDGKGLKTDIYDAAPTLSGGREWKWDKTMQFKADDASLETELIARVMAHDEESFHDATIGSVSIPLKHVYQMCKSIERAAEADARDEQQPSSGPVLRSSLSSSDAHSSFDAVSSPAVPAVATPVAKPAPGFDAWFSVLDRDGFVVGELRLNFKFSSSLDRSQVVAPVVSKKRFSLLFGSLFSSETQKEVVDALPSDDAQREILLPQLVPAPDQEAVAVEKKVDEDDQKDSDAVVIHDLPLIARRLSGNVSPPPLKSIGANARASIMHVKLVKQRVSSVDEADDDDEEEEEEKQQTATSHTEANRSPQSSGGAVGFLRGLVSKKKFRFTAQGFDLDLSYIGERMIAMGFPSEGQEAIYRNPMDQVQLFFKTFHSGAYKVYNLCSERKYDHAKFETCENGRVAEYAFDDHNPPGNFSLIVDYCLDVHTWLTKKPENVAATHCKAGKGRTGLMICCYLLFAGICAHPDAALTYFAVHRTSNGKGVTIPSQLRYVRYFHRYLTGYFDVNRPFPFSGVPLLLTHLRMTGIPKFDMVSGGCDPFFTIFQGDRCVFDFQQFKLAQGGAGSRSGASGGVISSSSGVDAGLGGDGRDTTDHVDFKVFVWLRGDCKILFYERDRLGRSQKIAWCWLNTAFIAEADTSSGTPANYVRLRKNEVDHAIKDKECKHFPPHFQLEFWFAPSTTNFADPRDGHNDPRTALAARVVNLARTQAEEDAEDEENEDEEEDEHKDRRPVFATAFDPLAAAEAHAVCHAQAVSAYSTFTAEQEETAMLFAPVMPA